MISKDSILKRGLTIFFVFVVAFAGHKSLAQGTQSDFPAFGDVSMEIENRIEIYPNPAA